MRILSFSVGNALRKNERYIFRFCIRCCGKTKDVFSTRWPYVGREKTLRWRMSCPLWTVGKKAKQHRLPKNKRAIQIAGRLSRRIYAVVIVPPFPDFSPPFVPPVRRYILFFSPPLSRLRVLHFPFYFIHSPFSLSFLLIIHRAQHANKRAKGLHTVQSRERDTRYSLNIAVPLFLAIMGHAPGEWKVSNGFFDIFFSLSFFLSDPGSREKN